jgi:hypothetical protein
MVERSVLGAKGRSAIKESAQEAGRNPHQKLTRYQWIVIWSIIMVVLYQVVFMLILFFYKNPILWQTALIFSGGISLGGYIGTIRTMWNMEQWEKKIKAGVFDQYGIDIDDPEHKNTISFLRDNEGIINQALVGVKKEKLEQWLQDNIRIINNYDPIPPVEDWAKELDSHD